MCLHSPEHGDNSRTAAEERTDHAVAAVSPDPKKTCEQKGVIGGEGRGQESESNTEMSDAPRGAGSAGSNGKGENEVMEEANGGADEGASDTGTTTG